MASTGNLSSDSNISKRYMNRSTSSQEKIDGSLECEPSKSSSSDEAVNESGGKVKAVDGEDRPFSCPLCKKTFKQAGHRNRHQKLHYGNTKYSCPECSKSFRDNKDLDVHMRVHTEERPYKCAECGRVFLTKVHLRAHQRSHTSEKPHKCSQCELSFIFPSYLKRHQQVHSGEKPHKCPECPRAFSRKTHLNRHVRSHTMEQPIKCEQSDKEFNGMGNLVEHQSVHDGERSPAKIKPSSIEDEVHQCPVCPQSFHNKATLHIHFRSHTGERPFDNERTFNSKISLILHQKVHDDGKESSAELESSFDSDTSGVTDDSADWET